MTFRGSLIGAVYAFVVGYGVGRSGDHDLQPPDGKALADGGAEPELNAPRTAGHQRDTDSLAQLQIQLIGHVLIPQDSGDRRLAIGTAAAPEQPSIMR